MTYREEFAQAPVYGKDDPDLSDSSLPLAGIIREAFCLKNDCSLFLIGARPIPGHGGQRRRRVGATRKLKLTVRDELREIDGSPRHGLNDLVPRYR